MAEPKEAAEGVQETPSELPETAAPVRCCGETHQPTCLDPYCDADGLTEHEEIERGDARQGRRATAEEADDDAD